MRLCCLTCQLPRFLDLVVEQLVEVGDEVVGRALLNDVADLLRQVHRLESGKGRGRESITYTMSQRMVSVQRCQKNQYATKPGSAVVPLMD